MTDVFVRAIESAELGLLRGDGQYAEVFVIPRIPNVIYTARLATVPTSTDMVGQISFNTGSGTLTNIKIDMTIKVGTTAGKDDLGRARIRLAPTDSGGGTGIFFIGEISHIRWESNCHLTVIDDFDIAPRHIKIVNGAPRIDYSVVYTNQHSVFEPIVRMGGHVVKELPTGGSVSFARDASRSSVFGSTITAYSWEAPGSSSLTGATTATPTVGYNAPGHYALYCTVTAANGKTYFGVRYVFIVAENPESYVNSISIRSTIEDGGTSFDVEMTEGCDLTLFPKHTFVIAYSKDYFDKTPTVLGYNEGEENVLAIGRVSSESLQFNEELGTVSFSVSGYSYWLRQISCFPSGIEESIGTPNAWTNMKSLTVDQAVFHILHYRCTVTRITDVYFSGDERLAAELASLSTTLQSQIEEVALAPIFADLIFEPYGTAYLRVEPQLVPGADRSAWTKIQDITSDDWQGMLNVTVNPHPEQSQVNLSGVAIPQVTQSIALFSLSTGHIPMPFGGMSLLDRLLLSSQEQSNQLSGLALGWNSREIEDIGVTFMGNNRMFSIAQYCYADINITAASNPRGLEYTGKIVPRAIALTWEQGSGYMYTSMDFQPESVEQLSVNGDIPADSGIDPIDFSLPPLPTFPPLPPFTPVYPSPSVQPTTPPKTVAILTDTHGVFYTQTFDQLSPSWLAMNFGFNATDLVQVTQMVITPGGVVYVMTDGTPSTGWQKIMRAPYLGGTWLTIFDADFYSPTAKISGLGVNPNQPDNVAIVVGEVYVNFGTLDTQRIYVGTNGVFSQGDFLALKYQQYQKGIVFWKDHWVVVGHAPSGLGGSSAAPFTWFFDSSGGLVDDVAWGTGAGATVGGCHAVSSVNLIVWGGNTTSDYSIFTDVGGTPTNVLDGIHPVDVQNLAVSPTNVIGMGMEGLNVPSLSIDSLVTWSLLTSPFPSQANIFENCNDDWRFIVGFQNDIYLTMDKGTTVEDKIGNLLDIDASITVTQIRFIN